MKKVGFGRVISVSGIPGLITNLNHRLLLLDIDSESVVDLVNLFKDSDLAESKIIDSVKH